MPPKKTLAQKQKEELAKELEKASGDAKKGPSEVSPSKPRRPGPVRPSHPPKRQNTVATVSTVQFRGSVIGLETRRADGHWAYIKDALTCLLSGHPSTKGLEPIGAFRHKTDRADADSEFVTVGKNGAFNKLPFLYAEDEAEAKKKAKQFADLYTKETKPFKKGMPPVKAKPGDVVNAGDPWTLEEYLSAEDVAKVVAFLYPTAVADRTFEDEDDTEFILGQYFCHTPIDEAKELVLTEYAFFSPY